MLLNPANGAGARFVSTPVELTFILRSIEFTAMIHPTEAWRVCRLVSWRCKLPAYRLLCANEKGFSLRRELFT